MQEAIEHQDSLLETQRVDWEVTTSDSLSCSAPAVVESERDDEAEAARALGFSVRLLGWGAGVSAAVLP